MYKQRLFNLAKFTQNKSMLDELFVGKNTRSSMKPLQVDKIIGLAV